MTKEQFKQKVIELMVEDGASEDFIDRELTDAAVESAIVNNFSPESLAWVLLQ